jgi:hypothetical protein
MKQNNQDNNTKAKTKNTKCAKLKNIFFIIIMK